MTSAMDEKQAIELLKKEGFAEVYVHEDAPGASYPEHTHAGLTTLVILEGEMKLTMDGETRTYGEGDRADVPAGKRHSAIIGPQGCKYAIGE